MIRSGSAPAARMNVPTGRASFTANGQPWAPANPIRHGERQATTTTEEHQGAQLGGPAGRTPYAVRLPSWLCGFGFDFMLSARARGLDRRGYKQ